MLTIRPYQLMCLVCAFGENDAGSDALRFQEIRRAIRENPDQPMALRCNAGGLFVFQDPGPAADTPGGADFNVKRDMEILLRMDLAPGSVLPARIALKRLVAAIASPAGICGFGAAALDAWPGCPKAASGVYEQGRQKALRALLPGRNVHEMAMEKETSLKAMVGADAIRVRPHILLCAVAQYGGGLRPPFKEDNLPEMLQHILKNPDLPITLAPGADWMMCASCPGRNAGLNTCIGGALGSQGIYNDLKDLNILQAIGLRFGDTLPAREMYRRIFERIPKPDGVCALARNIPETSIWRDGCGKSATPCLSYAKGRAELMKLFGFVSPANARV